MRTEEDARAVCRARQTVFEMMRDRGFRITRALRIEPHMLTAPYAGALDMTIEAKKKKKTVCVFWPTEEKVGVKTVREIVTACKKNGSRHAVIVYVEQITPFAKKEIDSYDDVCIEQFKRSTLQHNVTHHVLNPPMRVLAKKEALSVVERYGGDPAHLAKMLSSDAIARYYGLKRGAIVEIIRTSEEGHTSIAHRIVAG